MTIREATIEDMPAILTLGEEFFKVSGIPAFCRFNLKSCSILIRQLIQGDGATILVLEHAGEIVGILGAYLVLMPFNLDHINCQEMFWYIAPAHRGGTGALRLIKALFAWAEANGARSISMAAMEAQDREKVTKLYKAMKLQKLEEHWTGRI